MWEGTFAAIFYYFAVFIRDIYWIADTFIHFVQGTKTEEAVYMLHIMTRVKFAGFVFKIFAAHYLSAITILRLGSSPMLYVLTLWLFCSAA